MQALALWIERHPGCNQVQRQDILRMHPTLSRGHDLAAKICFQRNILECQRRSGPKSSGTGLWIITSYGRRVLTDIEICREDFATYVV